MKTSVARHHAILRQAIEDHQGQVFKIVGDSFQAAFVLAPQALSAALAAQHALLSEAWSETGLLKVRMGLHTGLAELEGSDYAVSHTLNRTARIMSAGHGGQILLSSAIVELLRGQLPQDVTLKDLGEHLLKGLLQPKHIFQASAPDLPSDFPALNSLLRQQNNLPV